MYYSNDGFGDYANFVGVTGSQFLNQFSNYEESQRSLNPNAAPFIPGSTRSLDSHMRSAVVADPERDLDDDDDDEGHSVSSLRDRLIQKLCKENLECLICFERVRAPQPIWSCTSCHTVIHLACAQRWADQSQQQAVEHRQSFAGWSCPACKTIERKLPREYRCFCGKYRNPRGRFGQHDTPHSCGNVCGRVMGAKGMCNHKCTLLCHPGPCPPCSVQTNRRCDCGGTKRLVRCFQSSFHCEKTCGKALDCGVHLCEVVCHRETCPPCKEKLIKKCFCGKIETEAVCNKTNREHQRYSCGAPCGLTLSCGNHECTKACHTGVCDECSLAPSQIQRCPCGRSLLSDLDINKERVSCTDPIPTCTNICGKLLSCGSPQSDRHYCKLKCHTGTCPPCSKGITSRLCRCGASIEEMFCANFVDNQDLLCKRKCTKKLSCKQHKCNQHCCIDQDHICAAICGRTLSCGTHTCDQLCHAGKCPPCLEASFDELFCECGMTALPPPVPCGARRPHCENVCTRQHSCDHPVNHSCHSETVCPPCPQLVSRPCIGGHTTRHNIPCHLEEVGCGQRCGEKLQCGHPCSVICHRHLGSEVCTALCSTPRTCGHPCNAKCHGTSPCSEGACLQKVEVACACGLLKNTLFCYDADALMLQKKRMNMTAAQMKTAHGRQVSIDAADSESFKNNVALLDCTSQCAVYARNKALAEALDIDESSSAAEPIYSDFLQQQYRSNSKYALTIERQLCDLIAQLDLQPTRVEKRTLAFPPMRSEQRRLIHEYAAHFDIETFAQDAEPRRSVTAIARRLKSRAPAKLLSAVMQPRMQGSTSRLATPAQLPVTILKPPTSTERQTSCWSLMSNE